MAKEYVVMKDGEELKTYKSLPAAKTLAEKEGAEVFCEGDCVYPISTTDPITPVEEVTVEKVEEPVTEKQVQQYTLTRKMNVREKPSLNANKLKVLDGGTVVNVAEVKDDWLHLTDGTFILYENGKNAKKN